MKKDALFHLYNQFTLFNADDFIFVSYEPVTHVLKFSQDTRTLRIPALRTWYLPDSKFKCGLLTPKHTHRLMNSLRDIIMNQNIDFEELIICPLKLGTVIYYLNPRSPIPYPMKYATIRYVSITNQFLVKLLCKYRYTSNLNPYLTYVAETKLKDKE